MKSNCMSMNHSTSRRVTCTESNDDYYFLSYFVLSFSELDLTSHWCGQNQIIIIDLVFTELRFSCVTSFFSEQGRGCRRPP